MGYGKLVYIYAVGHLRVMLTIQCIKGGCLQSKIGSAAFDVTHFRRMESE